jgi:serine phosphatase RsbU (regulator of sigma subunit)
VSAQPAFVQQVPLQVVPTDVAATVADLAFAGRYVPAGPGPDPVAGDFYDVLRLNDDLVALLVGDVSGHGTGAVARMQQLRAAARAYAIERPGPARVLARLDRFLERLDSESLATLWYGEYRPSTGTLAHASAGHPPPVLHVHGDPTRLLRVADAPPLGTGVAHGLAVEHEERLPPGAVLTAYSDGLVERRGTDLEGRLAVLRALVAAACDPARGGSAAGIAEEILDALVPDRDAAEDDVCLLVVRRQP